MKRLRRRSVVLVAAIVVAVGVPWYLWHYTPLLSHQVAVAFTENLLRDRGYRLELGAIQGNPLRRLTIETPRLIAERDRPRVAASAARLHVAVDVGQLLRGRVRVRELELEAPRIVWGDSGVAADLWESSRGGRRPAAPMPSMHVEALRIHDGQVQWEGRPRLEDLDLSLAVRADARGVRIDLRHVGGRWVDRGRDVEVSGGSIAWARDTLAVTDLGMRSAASAAVLSGWWTPRTGAGEVHGRVEPLELDPWRELGILPVGGVLRGPVAVAYRDRRLDVRARWTGSWDAWSFADVDVNLAWSPDSVFVRRAVGTVEGQPFDLRLRWLAGRMDAEARLEPVDLAALARPRARLPRCRLPLRLRMQGTFPDSTWSLEVAGGAGTLAGWSVDSLHAAVRMAGGRLQVDRAQVALPDAEVRVQGGWDTAAGLDLQWSARGGHGARLLEGLGRGDLRATLAARGSLRGPLDAWELQGLAELDSFRLDPWRAHHVVVEARVSGGEAPQVEAAVRADRVHAARYAFDAVRTRVRVAGGAFHFDRLQATRGDTTLAAAAVWRPARPGAGNTRLQHALELATALVQLGRQEIRVEDAASIRWSADGVQVDSLRLITRGGALRIDGRLDLANRRIDVRTEVRQFDLAFVRTLTRFRHQMAGTGTGWLEAHGPLDRTQIDANLRVRDGRWNSLVFDSLQVSLASEAFASALRRLEVVTPEGRLSGRGRIAYLPSLWRWVQGAEGSRSPRELAGAGVEAAFHLDRMRLDRIWAARGPEATPPAWQAMLSADVVLGGTVEAPEVTLAGEAQDFTFHGTSTDSVRFQLHYADHVLRLRQFAASASGAHVEATGELPMTWHLVQGIRGLPDAPLRLTLTVPRSSFAIVPQVLPLFEAAPRDVPVGTFTASLEVEGSLNAPQARGDLTVEGASFTLEGMEEVYYDAFVQGTFAGNTLNLESLRARTGKSGTLEGQGKVVFAGLRVVDYHLSFDGERIAVYSIPEMTAEVSGHVEVEAQDVGGEPVPFFQGRLRVLQATITREFGEEGGGDVLGGTDRPEWLAEIQLEAPGNVWVKNSQADVELEGSVQWVRDRGGMDVKGLAKVKRGTYSLYLERFTITRGELDFSRHPGFQPELDIEARQGRPGRRIYVHLTGHPPDNLQYTLSSDTGDSPDELQQILFGIEGEDPNNAVTTVAERILQDLRFIESVQIDPAAVDSTATGTAVVPLNLNWNVSAGKAISDRVFLVYTYGLNQSDISQRVAVEVDIIPGLLLESSYERRNIPDGGSDRSQNAFDVDLKFRYEY